MDMLVLRERSRRGIHNNGYDVSSNDGPPSADLSQFPKLPRASSLKFHVKTLAASTDPFNRCALQGEPEPFEETNVDHLISSLGFGGGSTGTGTSSLGVKAHCGSDSSTLSSQPSIDEVRTQMQMLLGNAFSLAAPDHDPPSPPNK